MKPSLWESLGVTAFALIFLKVADIFLSAGWISNLVPSVFLYLPLGISIYFKRRIDYLDHSWQQTKMGLKYFFLSVLLVFPPYLIVAHFWMLHVFHFSHFELAPWQEFTRDFPLQLLVVALPEEFFFRGHLQSILRELWQPKWKILGAWLGWGWILTALIFALSHYALNPRWWNFSIFFPALIFGYLREKTGSITAPILFHAFCNCFMNWFAMSYF